MIHIDQAASAIQSAKCIVVLSGAGMSQESGLPTFRDIVTLRNEVLIEETATARALQRDPKEIWNRQTALLERFESFQPKETLQNSP
jgi:NAD-dependent deacetylase